MSNFHVHHVLPIFKTYFPIFSEYKPVVCGLLIQVHTAFSKWVNSPFTKYHMIVVLSSVCVLQIDVAS